MNYSITFSERLLKFVVEAHGIDYTGKQRNLIDTFNSYHDAKKQDEWNRATY